MICMRSCENRDSRVINVANSKQNTRFVSNALEHGEGVHGEIESHREPVIANAAAGHGHIVGKRGSVHHRAEAELRETRHGLIGDAHTAADQCIVDLRNCEKLQDRRIIATPKGKSGDAILHQFT
jgi:hypothetical protein